MKSHKNIQADKLIEKDLFCMDKYPDINWDNTIKKFGRRPCKVRKFDFVIAKCQICDSEREMKFQVFKQNVKYREKRGKSGWQCHNCSTKSTEFKKECSIRAKKKWQDPNYDYGETNYTGTKSRIKIICPMHGPFVLTAESHLKGSACPACSASISRGHLEISELVRSLGVELYMNDRTIISPYELDIYVPKENIAIEYHGIYWHAHGEEETSADRNYHSMKHELCANANIRLIQIFEHEWKNKKNIVTSMIRNAFGKSSRIYARRCKISVIKDNISSRFMEKSHIQGHRAARLHIALIYNENIVAVMSFNKHHKYEWEIIRFANALNTSVVGGASRLFRYFVKNYKPSQVISYADRRYSTGDLYKNLEFKFDGTTSPNYFYVKSGAVYSRQRFQKHKMGRLLEEGMLDNFDPGLSESINMINNNYKRIWDAGHWRFIWRI